MWAKITSMSTTQNQTRTRTDLANEKKTKKHVHLDVALLTFLQGPRGMQLVCVRMIAIFVMILSHHHKHSKRIKISIKFNKKQKITLNIPKLSEMPRYEMKFQN
jgi:hypothetical protein